MGFSASTRQLGTVTVVDVRGRFTLIEGEAVHELLLDLFEDGRKRVLLNFRDVSYLDSSGIGQLIRGLYTARKNNAELHAVDQMCIRDSPTAEAAFFIRLLRWVPGLSALLRGSCLHRRYLDVYKRQAEVVSGVQNARDPDQGEVTTKQVPEDDVPTEYDDQ